MKKDVFYWTGLKLRMESIAIFVFKLCISFPK